MQQTPSTLCSTIQLPDLELTIEIHKVMSRAYYKVFYQGEQTLSDYDINGITFDFKGAIYLLNYLSLYEKVEPHEDLTDYLVEYDDEKGTGPRTTYFKNAFTDHTQKAA